MTWHLIDDPDNQPPKDGTEFLILEDKRAAVVKNYGLGGYLGRGGTSFFPTHWAPMLPPPDTQD